MLSAVQHFRAHITLTALVKCPYQSPIIKLKMRKQKKIWKSEMKVWSLAKPLILPKYKLTEERKTLCPFHQLLFNTNEYK